MFSWRSGVIGRALHRLWTGVWVIPGAFVLGAMGLSVVARVIDDWMPIERAWFLFRGGPEGARSILDAVASSMMAFTGVVFSVTILVLQLASSQFSPRVLRTFLRDRPSQIVLGIFVGTFAYALMALRSVRGESDEIDLHVPALSVWLSVVLALLSVAAFVFFIHHISQSIRAVNVLSRIGDETRRHLGRLYPEGIGEAQAEHERRRPEGPPDAVVPYYEKSGVVAHVDEEALWSCACEADVAVALVPCVGDFVPYGSPLFEVWGDCANLDAKALLRAVTISNERSMRQDIGFGIRQLVDVAERALSPGINDPTTAVQALDQLHDLLRRLVRRDFPRPYRVDAQDRVRLVLPRPDFADYLRMALDEIRDAGGGSIQVARRLRFLLEDLLRAAPPFRRGPIVEALRQLDGSVAREFQDRGDVRLASESSAQGHGPH